MKWDGRNRKGIEREATIIVIVGAGVVIAAAMNNLIDTSASL